MSEHKAQDGKVLGVVLSPYRDDSSDLFMASQALAEGSSWTKIVLRIRDGDSTASEELYPKVLRWIEHWCRSRVVPDESDDRVQETYLATLKAIRNGELREPEKLLGFIRVIGHRQYCAYIRRRIKYRASTSQNEAFEFFCRSRFNAEHDLLGKERRSFAKAVLAQLAPREREILERFYVREESADWICQEMNLTSNQFRLLKSRAKAKVAVAARKNMRVSAFRSTLVRYAANASKNLHA
jgi:RNA polymerase sigma-70 factor (ECF subfamily)